MKSEPNEELLKVKSEPMEENDELGLVFKGETTNENEALENSANESMHQVQTFSCPYCSKDYTNIDVLKNHIKKYCKKFDFNFKPIEPKNIIVNPKKAIFSTA